MIKILNILSQHNQHMQTPTFLSKIRAFFTRKRLIWLIVLLIVIFAGWFFFGRKSSVSNIQTGIVKKQDIQKTVLTTGQVVSSTDLDLSFQAGGVVRSLRVKEGDVVKAGQVLATLDQGTSGAQLESARASLAQAEASYNKMLAAATPADIAVSQASVNAAETTLANAKQSLKNAISNAYNNANTVVLSDTNILFSNPQSYNPQFTIVGTVQTNAALVSKINGERVEINSMLENWQTEVSLLNESNIDTVVLNAEKNLLTISNYLSDIINVITTFTQVTSGGSQTTVTTYQSGVAGGKATVDAQYNALAAAAQAVKTAESSLVTAKASLSLKQAPARQEDLDIARAQVLAAQASVHSAESQVSNTVIVAPIAGTITQVDIKLGEQATPSKEVMKLINVGELHAEALVSEADIASVQVGQTIDVTFDALGPDQNFTSKVLTVNPASTVISGVVDYKVTASLENIIGVKPGMTANMTILVDEKKDVVSAPSSAIVNQDGKKFVKVIDDPKEKTYHQVEVTVGLSADGGLTEITSGLTEGQEIVTYIK